MSLPPNSPNKDSWGEGNHYQALGMFFYMVTKAVSIINSEPLMYDDYPPPSRNHITNTCVISAAE